MPRIPLHRHYLTFDPGDFRTVPDPNEAHDTARLWDPDHWESFLDRLAASFGASRITDRCAQWAGGTLTYYVAETSRLRVGIDSNGPDFVFLSPKCYERRGGAILRPYQIDAEARKGFNRLIRACPEVRLSRIGREGIGHVVRRYQP